MLKVTDAQPGQPARVLAAYLPPALDADAVCVERGFEGSFSGGIDPIEPEPW